MTIASRPAYGLRGAEQKAQEAIGGMIQSFFDLLLNKKLLYNEEKFQKALIDIPKYLQKLMDTIQSKM